MLPNYSILEYENRLTEYSSLRQSELKLPPEAFRTDKASSPKSRHHSLSASEAFCKNEKEAPILTDPSQFCSADDLQEIEVSEAIEIEHIRRSIRRKELKRSNRYQTPNAWERVLWKRQAYEDNYMPPKRLVSVIMKGPRNTMTYSSLLSQTCLICQPMMLAIILLYIDRSLQDHDNPHRPSSISILYIHWIAWGLVISYGIFKDVQHNRIKMSIVPREHCTQVLLTNILARIVNAITVVLLHFTLYFISVRTNIIRSISNHISSDSASNTAGILLIAHVLRTDYNPCGRSLAMSSEPASAVSSPISNQFNQTSNQVIKHTKPSNGLATNLGIFCGILMASRMEDGWDAYALMCSAVMLFALFPMVRNHFLPEKRFQWNLIVTPLLIYITTYVMKSTNETKFIINLLFYSSIGMIFVIPLFYMRLQNRQITIRGPWDIPIVVSSNRPAG